MRLLCVNYITGSMRTWVHAHILPPVLLKVTDIFKYPEALAIHTKIYDDDQPPPLTDLSNMAHTIPNILSYHLFDCCYIPLKNQTLCSWVSQFLNIITTYSTIQPSELSYVTFWFNGQVLTPESIPTIHYLIVNHTVSRTWNYSPHVYKLTEFGILLDGTRVAIQLIHK